MMLRALLIFCTTTFAYPQMMKLSDFGKKEIFVGGKKIAVYWADNKREYEQGLMNVTHLSSNEGMMFVFNREEFRIFWMKDTKIPLSIGFFDKNKRLLQTIEMVPEKNPQKDPTLYRSEKPAQYVLEMNKGWFQKNKIKVGARLEF